jgi:hypothetical protein
VGALRQVDVPGDSACAYGERGRATIIPHAVFDVDAVMKRSAEEHVSMLPGSPTVYQAILDHPRLAEFDMSSLRLAVTGAAAIPVERCAACTPSSASNHRHRLRPHGSDGHRDYQPPR